MKRRVLPKIASITLVISALLLYLIGLLFRLLVLDAPVLPAICTLLLTLVIVGCSLFADRYHSLFTLNMKYDRAMILFIVLLAMVALICGNGDGVFIPLVYALCLGICLNGQSRRFDKQLTLVALTAAAYLASAIVNSLPVILLLFALSLHGFFRLRKAKDHAHNIALLLPLLVLPAFALLYNLVLFQAFAVFDDLLDLPYRSSWCMYGDMTKFTRLVWNGSVDRSDLSMFFCKDQFITVMAYEWGRAAAIACVVLMGLLLASLLYKRITAPRGLHFDLSGLACFIFFLEYLPYLLVNTGLLHLEYLFDDAVPLLTDNPCINCAALILLILLVRTDYLQKPVSQAERFDDLLTPADVSDFRLATLPLFGKSGTDSSLRNRLADFFSGGKNSVELFSDPRDFWFTIANDYNTVQLFRFEGSVDAADSLQHVFDCHGMSTFKFVCHPDTEVVDLFNICSQLLADDVLPTEGVVEYDTAMEENTISLYAAMLTDSCFARDTED